MRVISGSCKGIKLEAPKGLSTRPTTDRVKESLFNIIQYEIDEESKILDLFAGSGGLGIECLSRGASEAIFVDNSRESASIIRYNVDKTKLNEKSKILNIDMHSALSQLKIKNFIPDIIFLDPPYGKGLIEESILKIQDLNLFSKNTIIVSERDKNDELNNQIGKFRLRKEKKYGNTIIAIMEVEEV